MGKGFRAFWERLTRSLIKTDTPIYIPYSLPDGRTIDIPAKALKANSGSFKTHKIVMNHPNRLEVVETLGMKIFFGVFAAFGAIALVVMLPHVWKELGKESNGWIGVTLCLVLGVVFLGLGVAGVLGYWSSNAVLERRVGLYWKGRVPKAIRHWAEPPIALEGIAAVQVCSFRVQDSDSNYTAYEINLILAEPLGKRINLMSHGKRSALESDAKQVAEFLDRPLLDHIDFT